MSLLTNVLSFLKPVKSSILSFAKAGLAMLTQAGGDALLKAAKAGVEAAERAGGTNADKYNAARKSIERTLRGSLKGNAINLAIELAVAQLPAK